jgi:ubiquinone/menaquinone biosynthesis C-methylase UbiE
LFDPLGAIREMHRVLRPGGTALIIDMRKDASDEEISDQVKKLRVGAINAFVTKIIFKHMLRKRAYSGADFARILAATPFGGGEITEVPFGLEVRLAK